MKRVDVKKEKDRNIDVLERENDKYLKNRRLK
jgi:hypothetical protein